MSSPSPPSESPRLQWFIRLTYGFIVLVLVVGGIAIYQGATTAARARKTLRVTLVAVDLLKAYAEQTGGEWPRSWDDLQAVPPVREGDIAWPDDRAEFEKRVYIDFQADPQVIAQQKPEEFEAVKPIGSYFEFRDRGSVAALIKLLQGEEPAAGGEAAAEGEGDS